MATAPRFHRATSGTLLIGAGVPGLRELLDVPGIGRGRALRHGRPCCGASCCSTSTMRSTRCRDLPLAQELADRRWRLLLAAQIEEALAVLKATGIAPAAHRRRAAARDPLHPAAARLAVPAGGAPHAGDRSRTPAPPCGRIWRCAGRPRSTICRGRYWRWPTRSGVAAPITERVLRLVKSAESAGAGSPEAAPEQVASV